MTAVQIDTIPNSPENKRLLYSLSKETGKWIVVAEEGFKYHIDMYNQIYGKSKISNNKPNENNSNGYLAGKWVREGTEDSTFEISDVKGTEFKFSLLSVNSAGRTGDLNGVAKINGNTANYKIDEINAEVIFNLSENQIVIEGKGNINANNGMGVTFEGKYLKK